jgi:hypothetical protein
LKSTLERKVAQLVRLGWTKSPVSESLISPGGDRRVTLMELAQSDGYPSGPTPPAEKEEWRTAQLLE